MATLLEHRAARAPRAQPLSTSHRAFGCIWIIEDDAQSMDRQRLAGVLEQRLDIRMQVHKLVRGKPQLAASIAYQAGDLPGGDRRSGRAGLALEMLDLVGADGGLAVAGTGYGGNRLFVPGVLERGMQVAAEVSHESRWTKASGPRRGRMVRASELLRDVRWESVDVVHPVSARVIRFQAAELGEVTQDELVRAVAFTPGSVVDRDGDLRIVVTSLLSAALADVVQSVGWARWIRLLSRRLDRERMALDVADPGVALSKSRGRGLAIVSRPNLRVASQHDRQMAPHIPSPLRPIGARPAIRNVIELFAGAGGLGLGFLLAGDEAQRYRILASAEVEPIYVETLRQNHAFYRDHATMGPGLVPGTVQAIDLRNRTSQDSLRDLASTNRGVDIVIGGPPCQGFSTANRNSWSAANPHNQLVDVFLRLARQLAPKFVLLENVQGILWTDQDGSRTRLSVADHIARSFERAGYATFPKVLDAAWYGVPQHRARFFLLGVHRDLGYSCADFGSWGPFPEPTHGPSTGRAFVSVGEAIGDLPELTNGAGEEITDYVEPSQEALQANPYLARMRSGADREVVTDHVTSRHAAYVIERYRRIPQGGNWESIIEMMTNYANVDRTHSNIYRRLRSDEPAITIGHYRKSMIVHPSQHRGLSLREAARLQSFPDWFRFAGSPRSLSGGLMHKQQQLANAVSPMLAASIASFLLTL